MKVFGISDLHLEMYESVSGLWNRLVDHLPEAEVLILAGDIGYPSSAGLGELLQLFQQRYPHVLYVPGNHEYYDARNFDREACAQQLRQVCDAAGVHLLDKNVWDWQGVRFVGTTLWSAVDRTTTKHLNDFNYAFRNQFDYLGEFVDSYRWLQRQLRADYRDPEVKMNVVITHHLPSPALVDPKYKDSPLNSGFCTDILDEVWTPKLHSWYCGHTHTASRQVYRDCELICNPMGYPHESDCRTHFQVDKIE